MTKRPTPRTWNDGWRCAECCNGDRCDDPTHHDRATCPHCKGTGLAIWNMYAKEAEATALKAERDALREALRELYEARRAPFPAYECGHAVQVAWSNRIYAAEDRARALLDREAT